MRSRTAIFIGMGKAPQIGSNIRSRVIPARDDPVRFFFEIWKQVDKAIAWRFRSARRIELSRKRGIQRGPTALHREAGRRLMRIPC